LSLPENYYNVLREYRSLYGHPNDLFWKRQAYDGCR
jgi:hypothetical protein